MIARSLPWLSRLRELSERKLGQKIQLQFNLCSSSGLRKHISSLCRSLGSLDPEKHPSPSQEVAEPFPAWLLQPGAVGDRDGDQWCLTAAGGCWAQSLPLPSLHRAQAKNSVHRNVQNVSCALGRWKMQCGAIRSGIWILAILFFIISPDGGKAIDGSMILKLAGSPSIPRFIYSAI